MPTRPPPPGHPPISSAALGLAELGMVCVWGVHLGEGARLDPREVGARPRGPVVAGRLTAKVGLRCPPAAGALPQARSVRAVKQAHRAPRPHRLEAGGSGPSHCGATGTEPTSTASSSSQTEPRTPEDLCPPCVRRPLELWACPVDAWCDPRGSRRRSLVAFDLWGTTCISVCFHMSTFTKCHPFRQRGGQDKDRRSSVGG